MKRKFGKSIFTKLLVSFFVFLFLLFLTMAGCLLAAVAALDNGDMENLMPYSHVDSHGNIKNPEGVTNLGGWIEELDEDYRVIKVYGAKRNQTTEYTQAEIYDLISLDSENELMGFLYKPEQHPHYFLCLYQRELFSIQTTVMLNGDQSSVAYDRSNWFIGIFFVLLFAEVVGISLYLRKKIKRPLEQLADGMTRIRSGEEHVVLDIKTEAEFQQIVNAFNTMTRKLEQEKQENERIIAQKNQLLLELSHDIRTPIATIKSYASALGEGLVPEEKKQSCYHTIDLKADRVQQLAEDMFFMLKVDNPNDRLALEETDLGEFLRKVCAEYYDEIKGVGFSFEIDIPEEPVPVSIDRRLFARVIGNLLSNAKKYNQTGTMIGIRCETSEGCIQLQVTDDGAAIEGTLAERMFTAFVRGDETRKSDGGTGLGLSISKIIVEKHGGTIQYRREKDRNVFEIGMRG